LGGGPRGGRLRCPGFSGPGGGHGLGTGGERDVFVRGNSQGDEYNKKKRGAGGGWPRGDLGGPGAVLGCEIRLPGGPGGGAGKKKSGEWCCKPLFFTVGGGGRGAQPSHRPPSAGRLIGVFPAAAVPRGFGRWGGERGVAVPGFGGRGGAEGGPGGWLPKWLGENSRRRGGPGGGTPEERRRGRVNEKTGGLPPGGAPPRGRSGNRGREGGGAAGSEQSGGGRKRILPKEVSTKEKPVFFPGGGGNRFGTPGGGVDGGAVRIGEKKGPAHNHRGVSRDLLRTYVFFFSHLPYCVFHP